MSIRIKTRWYNDGKSRNLDEIASALSFTCMKISTNALLELENEGFATYSNVHRLDVVKEFLAFLLQSTDRFVHYLKIAEKDRFILINAMGHHLLRHYVENKTELIGEGDYKSEFLDLINQRVEEYSELTFVANEAQVDFLRHFGQSIENVMGESTNKHWVGQHIAEMDGPFALKTLRKAVMEMLVEE